jgi:hypothetical protein
VNDDYVVALDKECATKESGKNGLIGRTLLGHPVWHLRIYRKDGGKLHDWCAIQAIKNEIVGPEYEAIELYPAASRLMDEGNCYHLWVLVPNEGEERPPWVPLGFNKVPRFLMLKEHFLGLPRKKRQEIRKKGGVVAIFPDDLIPMAKKEYPGEELLIAVEKYVENHKEIVDGLEKWPAENYEAMRKAA